MLDIDPLSWRYESSETVSRHGKEFSFYVHDTDGLNRRIDPVVVVLTSSCENEASGAQTNW